MLFVANLLWSLTLKELWANIWQRYGHKFSPMRFWLVYICIYGVYYLVGGCSNC